MCNFIPANCFIQCTEKIWSFHDEYFGRRKILLFAVCYLRAHGFHHYFLELECTYMGHFSSNFHYKNRFLETFFLISLVKKKEPIFLTFFYNLYLKFLDIQKYVHFRKLISRQKCKTQKKSLDIKVRIFSLHFNSRREAEKLARRLNWRTVSSKKW